MRVRGLVLGGLFALLLTLSGCGGGSSSTPAPEAVCTGGPPAGLASPGQNSQPVYESTCPQTVNIPVVTLTICVPNTNTCHNVPNILLDFGSTGLRLSHTLPIAGELPQETANGQPLSECYFFESGYNYGPVVTATVSLGTTPVTVPVQISNSSLSAPCGSLVSPSSSSAPFEPLYNGILGVLFPQYDNTSSSAIYLAGEQVWTPAQNETVQNPVYLLTSNNTGVLLSITSPPITSTSPFPSQGAPGFTGTLTFGAPSGGTSLQTDQYGEINAVYPSGSGSASVPAFFDTGSNGFFIENPDNIPNCTGNLAGFFCGNAPSQSATLTGTGTNQSYTLTFAIDNAQTLLSTGNTVFSTLGGYQQGIFDAGFPAFLYGNAIGLSWTSACSQSQGQGCFVIQ